jgi:hypothetical protein
MELQLTTPVSPDKEPHRFPVYDFDPLEQQVCAREDEAVIRDPELDAEPTIVRAVNGSEPGIRPVDPHPSQFEGRNR